MATFTTKNGDIETTAEEDTNGGVTVTSKNTAGKPLTKDNLAVKGGFKDDGSYQITVTPNPAPADKSDD